MIDVLLSPPAAAPAAMNGAFGPLGVVAGIDDEQFGGMAAAGWSQAHTALSGGSARIGTGDDAFAAALTAIREREAQTRTRLTGIRAELLELMQAAGDVAHAQSVKYDLVEAAMARAQELRTISIENQRFSEQIRGRLMAAAAHFRGNAPAG